MTRREALDAVAEAGGTPLLSPEELSRLERRAVITILRDVELVGGLGVTPETVSRWETGAEPFKRPVQLAVCELVETVERSGSLPQRKPSAQRELRVA